MNLQKVAELKDLYPLLVTRSKVKIVTTEPVYTLTKDGLAVSVKTVFPPSARRRTELRVTANGLELHVEALEPHGMADAQRFAQLLRDRWLQDFTVNLAPLRLSKDEDGGKAFIIAPAPVAAPDTVAATPAAKAAPSPSKTTTEKGAL